MKLKYLAPVILIGMMASCNQAERSTDSTDTLVNTPKVEELQVADENTGQMLNHYLDLKSDLVSTKAEDAAASAQHLADALAKIDGCENAAQLASEIAVEKDVKIQREKFTALSSDVIALMKHADINSGTLYVQYCPMANDNDGGYWLAAEKTIRNPYYGSEMLNCGQVTETLAAK